MRIGEPIPPNMLAQFKRLEAMEDEDIDTSDMPAVTDWRREERGRYDRPIKKPYAPRLDQADRQRVTAGCRCSLP